tara:strand:- start:575 stop:703 length:129 start_codon:yes stop_codon:yes gene_type:complete
MKQIRKDVERIAKQAPGKGWTKQRIDQEVKRRYVQQMNKRLV